MHGGGSIASRVSPGAGSAGKPNESLFSDEIHPTFEGFKKVTQNIRKQMRAAGIRPL